MLNFDIFVLHIAHRVRLVGGPNQHTGRVEVYTNSTGGLDNAQWGTVCDDGWDILDARVVCYELGYPYAVTVLKSAHYGQGNGQIWFSNVRCLGNESNLFACGRNAIGNHSCEHDHDAAIECSGINSIVFIENLI